ASIPSRPVSGGALEACQHSKHGRQKKPETTIKNLAKKPNRHLERASKLIHRICG
ncbi:MAG: hypothetical protein ACI9EB_001781, partial [Pseudomonas sp.]